MECHNLLQVLRMRPGMVHLSCCDSNLEYKQYKACDMKYENATHVMCVWKYENTMHESKMASAGFPPLRADCK